MPLNEYLQTNIALGGEASVAFVSDLPTTEASILMRRIWRTIYIFEKQFSRFIPTSELSEFNRSAGSTTPTSPEFHNLLQNAKAMGILTEGLYNPFILPALQRAGYVESALAGYENDPQEIYTSKAVVDVSKLKIDAGSAAIPYGTVIDLGGCGKGYLLDQIADILLSHRVSGYWLSFSGDVATYGHDADGKEISVGIQDAQDLSHNLDWNILSPTEPYAIGTSGTFRRSSYKNDDKNWHHIIDPATLKPAKTNVLLATVCAPKAILADVLASCVVIMGQDKAEKALPGWGVTNWLIQYTKPNGAIATKKHGKLFTRLTVSEVTYA